MSRVVRHKGRAWPSWRAGMPPIRPRAGRGLWRGRAGCRASRTRPPQAEEERDDMERVKLDNRRILFNLLPAHVAQHFLMSNPRNMVSAAARAP